MEKSMRVTRCIAKNFASYEELNFDFTNQGLTLIHGATGSGKSTLCDLIPWALFGKTAKGGSVDEILSWPGNQVTTGTVYFDDGLEITRTRGPKSKDNDLYLIYENDTGTVSADRGKDIQDTQRIINDVLGLDYATYLSGAYFHEFSETAQFFSTSSKNRKIICEQIVDLSLAKKLKENTYSKRREHAKNLLELSAKLSALNTEIALLERMQVTEAQKAAAWQDNHHKTKLQVLGLRDKFEASRVKTHGRQCPTCKTVLEKPHTTMDDSENPYLSRLAELELEQNPHSGTVKDHSQDIRGKTATKNGVSDRIDDVQCDIDDLDQLEDALNQFRAHLIQNTIEYVETTTNAHMARHFDSELQVSFTIEENDKLDFTILKDGNICSFTQLSKGQRQILKLCFGVSVMQAVSNHKGIDFSQIFLDEALDGLDENFKIKAFSLLEELALTHESVFVVEHSEGLKAMFSNSHKVELVNGNSQICQN